MDDYVVGMAGSVLPAPGSCSSLLFSPPGYAATRLLSKLCPALSPRPGPGWRAALARITRTYDLAVLRMIGVTGWRLAAGHYVESLAQGWLGRQPPGSPGRLPGTAAGSGGGAARPLGHPIGNHRGFRGHFHTPRRYGLSAHAPVGAQPGGDETPEPGTHLLTSTLASRVRSSHGRTSSPPGGYGATWLLTAEYMGKVPARVVWDHGRHRRRPIAAIRCLSLWPGPAGRR